MDRSGLQQAGAQSFCATGYEGLGDFSAF